MVERENKSQENENNYTKIEAARPDEQYLSLTRGYSEEDFKSAHIMRHLHKLVLILHHHQYYHPFCICISGSNKPASMSIVKL
jgi:hypothetical protein